MTGMLCTIIIFIFLPGLSEAKPHSGGSAQPSVSRGPPPPPPPPHSDRAGQRRSSSSVSRGSGELSTLDGHRCTWQASGDALVSLLVQCTVSAGAGQQGQHRYWCRYAGRPALCGSYAPRSSRYWKQLVGRLKKRHNACEGHRLLRAKACSKAPGEAHMKLASHGTGEERSTGGGGEEGGGGGADGRRREKEEEEDGTGLLGDMEMNDDAEPVQSYCADGWNSVCSFFVRFFEG